MKRGRGRGAFPWGCLILLLAAACGTGREDSVGEGWVRTGGIEVGDVMIAGPNVGGPAAVYLRVRNRGDEADALTGLSAPSPASASLHRTVVRDGMSRMEAIEEIPLEPGGEVRLRPGDLHGMVMGLGRELLPGDSLRLTLRFRVADSLTLVVPVRDRSAILEVR